MDTLGALRIGAEDRDRVLIQEGPGAAVTYAQALDRAERHAAVLADLGLRKGDRVAVQVAKCEEALFLYFGCLVAGIVFLPLNPGYTPVETEFFLQDAETALYVADVGRLPAMAGHVPQGQTIAISDLADRVDAVKVGAAAVAHAPGDLAAILYTSGTTGRSKGVMLSRENLSSNARTLAQVWAFTAADVLLHALPIFHTHGLFVATNTVIFAGASMIFLPEFHPDAVFAALPRSTVMMGVPTFYTRLLADVRLTRDSVAHMRLFISGSAPLSAATHRDWAGRTGHAILERYGMTETNMNTSNPYDGERRPGTVGMALPGVDVRVTEPETGKVLAQGEVGLIEVRGPNVFQGYWRAPEKTAAEFRSDGFFMTGDLGMIDAQGYVAIVGRSKDLVISGGLNVYPAEVEAVLDDLEGIAASAVIGVPHPDFGEAVVAVVIGRKGADPDEAVLRAAMRERLAAFKIPKRIVFVAEFPRNAMGKVQKNILRQDWAHLFAQ